MTEQRIAEIRRRHADGPFGGCESCDLLARITELERERAVADATIETLTSEKAMWVRVARDVGGIADDLDARLAASEQRVAVYLNLLRLTTQTTDEQPWTKAVMDALASCCEDCGLRHALADSAAACEWPGDALADSRQADGEGED